MPKNKKVIVCIKNNKIIILTNPPAGDYENLVYVENPDLSKVKGLSTHLWNIVHGEVIPKYGDQQPSCSPDQDPVADLVESQIESLAHTCPPILKPNPKKCSCKKYSLLICVLTVVVHIGVRVLL